MAALIPLAVRELRRQELRDAAQLVGRGMRDNPSDVQVFRIANAERRASMLARFFVPVFRGLYQRGLVLGAFRSGVLVGVCGVARPGFCQPNSPEKVRALPSAILCDSVTTPLRILKWVREWALRDPNEPHWHLGPIAVEPHLQGQGIGSAMLAALCAVLDNLHALSYLETDKIENVRFYQRFGFTVTASGQVLGVSNWFMTRSPCPSAVTQNRPSRETAQATTVPRRA